MRTQLFQPRKAGNMDCTFCLDCIKACPHDNVGILAVRPGGDLIDDLPRSSVRRYAKRPDLAALVLVLTFGAFANAAGMVAPVLNGITQVETALKLSSDIGIVTLLSVLCLSPSGGVGGNRCGVQQRDRRKLAAGQSLQVFDVTCSTRHRDVAGTFHLSFVHRGTDADSRRGAHCERSWAQGR